MIANRARKLICPIDDMPLWEFGTRVIWISVQLLSAYCLARPGTPFFYQLF